MGKGKRMRYDIGLDDSTTRALVIEADGSACRPAWATTKVAKGCQVAHARIVAVGRETVGEVGLRWEEVGVISLAAPGPVDPALGGRGSDMMARER